jgi:hypothetical protein
MSEATMEMKGISPYSHGKEPPEKRQPPANASIGTPPAIAKPSADGNPSIPTMDTAHFSQPQPNFKQPQASNAQQQQALPNPNPTPGPLGNMQQTFGAVFERLASMAASFFKANQRDTVDDEFAERWEQAQLDTPDLFNLQSKVKDTHQSNLGGGNQ